MESVQQGQLRLVSQRRARGVHPGVELKTDRAGVARDIEDANSDQAPALNPRNLGLRRADRRRHVPLPKTGSQSGLAELIPEVSDQAPTDVGSLVHGSDARRHCAIVADLSLSAGDRSRFSGWRRIRGTHLSAIQRRSSPLMTP